MGLTIILENENGMPLIELDQELYFNSEDLYENNLRILKYVDLYGNTTFNAMMLDDLIDDLDHLAHLNPSQSHFIKKVIELAEKSRSQVHTYVKFIGD